MSYGVPMGPMGPLDRPVAVGAGLGGLRWPGWPIAAQIVIYRERTSADTSFKSEHESEYIKFEKKGP